MSRQIFQASIVSVCLAMISSVAQAVIVVEGTAEEQGVINDAISEIRMDSMLADRLFQELQDHTKTVHIGFGPTEKGGEARFRDGRVILNRRAIDCFGQIGAGKAKESMSLGLVIVHESLGHLLSFLKNGAKRAGEKQAIGLTNNVRRQLGLPTRGLKYFEINQNGKIVAPFSDGSFADFTAAYKKARKQKGNGTAERTSTILPTTGTVQLVGVPTLDGEVQLSLDPNGGFQTVTVDSSQQVGLNDLQLTLDGSTPGDPEVNLLDFDLSLDSLTLEGGLATGLNTIAPHNEGEAGAGEWDFLSPASDFQFDISGELLMTNSLFNMEGWDGLTAIQLAGQMSYDSSADQWTGTAALTAGLVVRSIPEPSAFLFVGIGGAGMLLCAVMGGCSCARQRRRDSPENR